MQTTSNRLVISFDQDDDDDDESRILLDLLATYQRLILSSVGPLRSKNKLISTKTDTTNTTLTSSARHLIHALYRRGVDSSSSTTSDGSLTQWKFDTIRSSVESAHLSRSFDSGLWLLYLINEGLARHKRDHLDRDVLGALLKSLSDKLNAERRHSDRCSPFLVKLNLDSLDFLRSLLRTVLLSNKLVTSAFEQQTGEASNAHKFVDLVLKLNLNSFNQSCEGGENEAPKEFVFGLNIYLFDHDSGRHLDDTVVFPGLLVKQPKFYSDQDVVEFLRSKCNGRAELRTVLFDTNSLSGDFESVVMADEVKLEVNLAAMTTICDVESTGRRHFLMLQKLRQELDVLIDRHNIDVILSQKVIHPSLKSHAQKRHVLVVDRLSLVYAQPLAQLMNCQIYNSTWELARLSELHVGRLRAVSVKRLFDRVYMHFEGVDGPTSSSSLVQTMIVCVPNESFMHEIEYLLEVVQMSFRRTIMNGAASIGGPCFYTVSMCYLWQLTPEIVLRRNKSSSSSSNATKSESNLVVWHLKQIKSLFFNFFQRLLQHDSAEYSLDLHSGHLFHRNNTECVCGLLILCPDSPYHHHRSTTTMMMRLDDDLSIELADFVSRLFAANLDQTLAQRINPRPVRLLDCLDSKLNALGVARDILTTILNIGVFIHD